MLASAGDVSLFRRIVRFSSWTEGWALYAEQVAGEMGVYDDNPFGRIGMLQSQLFRAARIVVDTGLHHERWGLQQAANWMIENAGELAVVDRPRSGALRRLSGAGLRLQGRRQPHRRGAGGGAGGDGAKVPGAGFP